MAPFNLKPLGLTEEDPEELLRRRIIPALNPQPTASAIGRLRIPEIRSPQPVAPPDLSAPQLPATDVPSILGKPAQPDTPAIAQAKQTLAAPQPKYHGLKRFLDTLGGATTIGQAIEAASGLGTIGDAAKRARAQGVLREAEGERATQQKGQYEEARTQEQQAKAEQERARAEAYKHPAVDRAEAKTVQVGDKVMQWNPETGRYDIEVGSAKGKPAKHSPGEVKLDEGIPTGVYGDNDKLWRAGDANMPAELKAALGDAQAAHGQKVREGLNQAGQGRSDARSDRSYQFHAGRIDKLRAPIEQRMERISRLEDTLNQGTPQADALIAPELLTVMAGGQGSGLRMNEAEIARIIGGRTNWETLKAKIDAWQLNPDKGFSLTPAQRQQTRQLFQAIRDRVTKKAQAIDEESQKLANADDPQEHRQIYNRLQKRLSDIDSGTQGSSTPPTNLLKEGIHTTFKNGQTWTLQNGIPTQIP